MRAEYQPVVRLVAIHACIQPAPRADHGHDGKSVAGEAAAMSGPDRFQDRCRGAMIGLAAGNLLGVPAEGWPRSAIRRHYPDGIREVETGPE